MAAGEFHTADNLFQASRDTFNALAAATDEDVPAGFGITIRRMFQQAGSSSANHRGAIKYAEEIRKLIWEKTRTRNYETTGL